MRNTERRATQDNGVLANGNDTTHPNHGDNVSGRRRLINELRGFAEGSTSARASLMRDAADALEAIERQLESADQSFTAIKTGSGKHDADRIDLIAAIRQALQRLDSFSWHKNDDVFVESTRRVLVAAYEKATS